MSNPSRSKSEKFEFRFRFQASKVPPGYEKLVVSLIPADTGKLEGQTSRVPVRNGICQWNDTVTEVVSLAYNERSKAFEPKTYRLLVSTGSTRTGILGEALLNFAEFVGFSHIDQRNLPLKYCAAGTILHATVQCVPQEQRGEDSKSDSGEGHSEEGVQSRPGQAAYGRTPVDMSPVASGADSSSTPALPQRPQSRGNSLLRNTNLSSGYKPEPDSGSDTLSGESQQERSRARILPPQDVGMETPLKRRGRSPMRGATDKDGLSRGLGLFRKKSSSPRAESPRSRGSPPQQSSPMGVSPRAGPRPGGFIFPREEYEDESMGGKGGDENVKRDLQASWDKGGNDRASGGSQEHSGPPRALPRQAGGDQRWGGRPDQGRDEPSVASSLSSSPSSTPRVAGNDAAAYQDGQQQNRGGLRGSQDPLPTGAIPQNFRPQGKLPAGAIPDGYKPAGALQTGAIPDGFSPSKPPRQPDNAGSAGRSPQPKKSPRKNLHDLSPVMSAGSSHGGTASNAEGNRDLAAELAAAESAIEDLQSECLKFQLTSRNLSREVDCLRFQLAEAIASDQMASNELAQLAEEREHLIEEINMLRMARGVPHDGEGGSGGGSGGGIPGSNLVATTSGGGHSQGPGPSGAGLQSREGGAGGGTSGAPNPDGGDSNSDWSSSFGGGPQGARRAMASLMEEAEFHKESALNLSAQVEMLQKENEELARALGEVEEEVVRYKRDAEELFLSNQERDGEVKRQMRQLEEEWGRKVRELEDAKENLQELLAEHQASADPEGATPQEGHADADSSAERGLTGMPARSPAQNPAPARATAGSGVSGNSSGTESEDEGGEGPGAGEVDGKEEAAREGLEEEIEELRRKVAALEKEAAELSEESLELASCLNVANKTAEMKDEQVEKLQRELEDLKRAGGKGWGQGSSWLTPTKSGGRQDSAASDPEDSATAASSESEGEGARSERSTPARSVGSRGPRAVVRTPGAGGEEGDVEARLAEKEREVEEAKEEAVKLRSKLRVQEMAMARDKERLSILETVERKTKELEVELMATNKVLAKQERLRADLEAAHQREVQVLSEGKEEVESQLSRFSSELRALEARAEALQKENQELSQHVLELFDRHKAAVNVAGGAAGGDVSGTEPKALRRLRLLDLALGELSARMADKEEELKKWVGTAEDLERQCQELVGTVGTWREDKVALEKRVRQMEEQKGLAESRVQEMEFQIASMQEALEAAKQDHESSALSASALATHAPELEEHKSAARVARRRAQELEGLVASMEGEMKDLESSLEEARAVASGHREGIEKARKESEERRQRAESLEAEARRLSAEAAAAASARRELEMKVVRLEGASGELQAEVQEAQAAKRRAEEEAAELQAQLAVRVNESESRASQVADLEGRCARLAEEAEASSGQLAALESELAKAQKELKAKEAALKEEGARLASLTDQVSLAKEAAEKERAGAARAAREWRAAEEGLKERVAALEQERAGLEARTTHAELELKALEAEKVAAMGRLQAEVDLLTQQLDAGGGQTEEASSAAQAAELRAVQGALEDKLRRAEGELRHAVSEKQRVESELQARTKQATMERSQLKAREAELETALAEAREEAAGMRELQAQVARLQEERAALLASLEETRAGKAELETSASAWDREKQALNGQRDSLAAKARECQELKAELAKATAERQLLEERRLALAVKLGKLEESLGELEELRMRNAAMAGELAETSAKASAAGAAREERLALEEKVRDLEDRLAVLSGLALPEGGLTGLAATPSAGLGAATGGGTLGAEGVGLARLQSEVRKLQQQNAELKRVVSEQKAELDSARAKGALGPGSAAGGGGAAGSSAAGAGAFGSRVGGGRAGGIMASKDKDSRAVEELRRKTVALEGELQKKAEALAVAEKRLKEMHRRPGSPKIPAPTQNDDAWRAGGSSAGADRIAALEMELQEALEGNKLLKEQLKGSIMKSSRDWAKGEASEQAQAMEELRAAAKKAEADLSELRAKYAALEAESKQLKASQNAANGGGDEVKAFSLDGGSAVSGSPRASSHGQRTASGAADKERSGESPSTSQGSASSSSSRLTASGSGSRSSPRARWSTEDRKPSSSGTASGAAEERRVASPRLGGATGSRIPRPAFVSGGKSAGASEKRLS